MLKNSLYIALAWGRGNPVLNQITTMPLDFLTALFGTAESSGGGIDISLQPWLNPPDQQLPSSYCSSIYDLIPSWKARANQLLRENNQAAASPSAQSDGWISLIDGPEQLSQLTEDQLECLLNLGYTPGRIPLGQVYGRILTLIGPQFLLDIGQAVWGGKIIIELECDNHRNITITCNNVGHGTGAFAHATIGTQPEGRAAELMTESEKNSGDWIFINYSQDFTKICPSLLPSKYMAATRSSRTLATGMFDNSWPARDVLDFGRWVGRDIDENLDIYLFKSRLTDFNGSGKLTEPILWFNLKSADLVEGIDILRF